jgi:hypothetical protein
VARDEVGIGVGVLEGCCWTRLGLDKEGCNPRDLCFLSFLSIEDNFGCINFGMMIENEEQEHEASRQQDSDNLRLVTNPVYLVMCNLNGFCIM